MRLTRSFLLVSLFCVSAISAAAVVDVEIHEPVIERRQDDNSTISTPPAVLPPLTNLPSDTSTDPSTEDTTTPSSTTTPPPDTTSPPETTTETTAETTPPTSTTPPPNTGTSSRTSRTPSPTPTTRVHTTVIVTRIGNADVTSTVVTTTIDMVTPTDPAASNPSSSALGTAKVDDVGGSSGLSTTQKNVVVGVVVGVGGAVLLAGLGFVLWRLKKRNTNPVDEDDLMRREGSPLAGSSGREMHSTSPDASPFQTTLDQYHKPPGQVNTAANF